MMGLFWKVELGTTIHYIRKFTNDVREHMKCVGCECHGTGLDTDDNLHNSIGECNDENDCQTGG